MKTKFISLVLMGVALLMLAGCIGRKTEDQTADNLIAAYNGESTVSAKYLIYAAIADSAQMKSISTMFKALSRSEEIHANNHRVALASLGIMMAVPEIGNFEIGTTEGNLRASIAGEQWEADTMYAGFIREAVANEQSYAREVLTWARDTEVKHARQLQKALDALMQGSAGSLPDAWKVCPKCGNTFEDGQEEDPCPFCETPSDEFEFFHLNK